jgi:hypothetical protein
VLYPIGEILWEKIIFFSVDVEAVDNGMLVSVRLAATCKVLQNDQ